MFPHLVDPPPPSVGEAELAAVKVAGRRRLRRQRRLRLGVGCAAAVLVLLGVIAVVNQQGRLGHQLTASADGDGLTGVDWQLQSLTVSNVPQDVPRDWDAALRFDGAGRYSGEACNHFGGTVTIDEATLRVSPEASTLMQCVGAIAEVERHIGRLLTGKVSWELRDRLLRLEGRDIVAVFIDDGVAFPTRDLQVLAEGRGESGEYQFGYHAGEGVTSLLWEGRSHPGQPWGSAGFAVTGGIDLHAVGVGERLFVFGYMPPGAVRAEYHAGGRETAMKTAPLPGGSSAFWGFVATPGGEVVAFDDAGQEVARSRRAPAP